MSRVPDDLVAQLFSRYLHKGKRPLPAVTLYERTDWLTVGRFRLPLARSVDPLLVAGRGPAATGDSQSRNRRFTRPQNDSNRPEMNPIYFVSVEPGDRE